MSRLFIIRVCLTLLLPLVTGCGIFSGDKYRFTSCNLFRTQVAANVGFQGEIRSDLPCPTLLPNGTARNVSFTGSLFAAASASFPTISYTLVNRVGSATNYGSETAFTDQIQNALVWQPNLLLNVGSGGFSGSLTVQDADTIRMTGTAAGGSGYAAWYPITYRSEPGATVSMAGMAFEYQPVSVSANLLDSSVQGDLRYDWEVDGELLDFDVTQSTISIPPAAAWQNRSVRVTVSASNGRQAIGNLSFTTYPSCPNGEPSC